MKKALFLVLGTAFILAPVAMLAQSKPTSATYITDEEVKAVNALPGIDRTIKVVDIGPENFAVGVIHRAAPAGRGAAAGAGWTSSIRAFSCKNAITLSCNKSR